MGWDGMGWVDTEPTPLVAQNKNDTLSSLRLDGYVQEDTRTAFVKNERLKLLATFVNGMGIAMFAVGVLAPMISDIGLSSERGSLAVLSTIICFVGAFALHYLGSTILRGLRP
jgi:hypothetical protein